jgi:replicative DNA helicase
MTNEKDISRKPPGSEEMDRAVISCMMQLPDTAIEAAVEILKASDFLTGHCAYLFDLIVSRHTNGHPVDAVSLAAHLIDQGRIADIGGAFVLSEISTTVSAPSAVRSYCEDVAAASRRRTVAKIATRMDVLAYDGPDDWREQMGQLIRELDTAMVASRKAKLIPVKDVLLEYVDRLMGSVETEIDPAVATGIVGLDELLSGGIRREYILIGGRQGHGKTLLAMQMAGKLAFSGRRGLIIGYEMTALQIVMRDIARESGIPLDKVMGRSPLNTQGDINYVQGMIEKMAKAWDIHYTESPYITLEGVASHARNLHRKKPLDFLVIDYLQLVPKAQRTGERADQALKTVSEEAERIRKELGCTLIAPVQLNDDGQIRDARSILDAPQVFLRIEMDTENNEDGIEVATDTGRIRCLKNRFGTSNRAVAVKRNGPLQRFEDNEDAPAEGGSERKRKSSEYGKGSSDRWKKR